MERSPYREANRFSTSQEILRILWKLTVYHHVHKCPPLVPILNQIDPVHVHDHFLKIHFKNIAAIFQFTLKEIVHVIGISRGYKSAGMCRFRYF